MSHTKVKTKLIYDGKPEEKVTVIDLTIPSDLDCTDEEDIYSDDDSIVVDDDELEYEEECEDEDDEDEYETVGLSLHFTNCTFTFPLPE